MGFTGRSLLCALSCLIAAATNGDVIYVKADATGSGDGSSWTNAFVALQPAIDAASVSDQVWIAQGTYLPTSWPNGGATAREKHFSLKNGVSVYGGFAGVETSVVERNSTACPTILSGDLDGNDTDSDGNGLPDPSTTFSNAYHVFYHPSGLALTNSAVLDGVIIRGGCANDLSSHTSGGGIFNSNASPTIANCIISGNLAIRDGGGIYSSYSSMALHSCTLVHNWAKRYGGAMGNSYSSPLIVNSTLASNSVDADGGGIYSYYSSMTLHSCTLAHNSATRGGGIFGNYYSSPVLRDCTIASNTAFSSGGGIWNRQYSSPTISNCIIAGNLCYEVGGGIFNDYSSSPVLRDCTIASNSSSGNAGGIYNGVFSSPLITNCIIANNSAITGGGIYNYDRSSPTNADCTFASNSATNGGGIYNGDYSSPTIAHSIFTSNSAARGGAIHNYNWSSPDIVNCVLAENSAADGGGICNDYYSSPGIINCTLAGNLAHSGAGIYLSERSWSEVVGCAFTSNSASGDGGAIFNSNVSPTIANCVLAGNSAANGGGIHNDYSSFDVTNCTFAGNSASSGAGIYIRHQSLIDIIDCAFTGNAASGNGGGIHITGYSSLMTSNCALTGNSAFSGGGIYMSNCSARIARSTLVGNSATNGGGIVNGYAASAAIANCTVAGNSAFCVGGGIYNATSSSPVIVNCTLVGNSATNGGGIYSATYFPYSIANCIFWANTPSQQIVDSTSIGTVSHCIVQNGYAGGTNIIDADPLLLLLGDHGGPTPTMPISLGSPAIDAGVVSGAPTTDQRGFNRDTLPDIGACEFEALALVSDVSNPAAIGSRFTLRAISDIAGATFQWFGRQSGNAWGPIEGGTNGLYATAPLDLGLDLWVRVAGQGTNVDSAVQQIDVRGTYPEWVAFHRLAGADANTGASPAGDSIPNLIKYASGLDPHAPAIAADHSTFFSNGASNTVCLTWIESKTPTDLTWGFRRSQDLLVWSPADAPPTLSKSNTAYNVWSIIMPVETNSLFLDVEVTRAAP